MSNILSQDEINALLGAISEGAIDASDYGEEPSLSIYDHNRPPFLSDTSLDYFKTFFTQLMSPVRQGLEDAFATPILIELASQDPLTFSEFVRTLPNPTLLFKVIVSDVGPMYVELDPFAGWHLLHAGAGTTSSVSFAGMSYHSADLSLLGRLLLPLWDGIQASLTAISKLKVVGLQMESNPSALATPADSQILLATYTIKIGESEHMMNLALPRNLVELLAHYLEQYNVGYYFKPEAPGEAKIRNWSRTMRLNLDMGKLELNDLASLGEGDRLAIHEIEEKKFRFRLQG